MILRFLAILAGVALASCQPSDGTYLMRGPGYELNAQRAAGTSRDLYAYMSVMCADAGLAPVTAGYARGCPSRLEANGYQTMLQAGFNEINSGCKAYVQFIFEERMRERRFKSSNSAIQAFISGVLTIESAGTQLFSYLILSSTAANAFYDASRIDPLQGMTVENILKIVDERQAAFEKAAASRAITSSPQLVRVWREYQWLCTPLAINSDFNALAAASIDGTKVDFDADARKVVNRITGTIEGVKKFNQDEGLKPTPKAGSVDGAVSAVEKELTNDQVMRLQSALCTTRDGSFGQGTRAAINVWRRMFSKGKLEDAELNQGLSSNDILYLLHTPSCSSLGYKTAAERGFLYDAPAMEKTATTVSVASGRAQNLLLIAEKLGVSISTGETKIDSGLRAAIKKKREALTLPKGDYIDYELFMKLFS
ncbi:hypothetical protein RWK44_33695 [Rhizobium sp. 25PS6]|uniref:hypothetical protein n=1 Tax=Rhizobium sp. 25PS6 TaxID=3075622 RepID=UPI0028FD03C3|nr:hypothetical protein [Rhizobium sp. 25PS6]MDU0365325.1 hypothetical protein [Rhizobium sp. 25PS6]